MPWTETRTPGHPHTAAAAAGAGPAEQARRWCAAVLKLADARERDEQDGETETTVRYAAQWFYVMWQPREAGLPHVLPDCWGLQSTDPRPEIQQEAGAAGWIELPPHDCAWSLWLDVLLNCEALAHWQRELILAVREEARREEQQHQRRIYGSLRPAFDHFMQQVLERDHRHAPDLSTASSRARCFDGLGAEQSRALVAMWPDGSLLVRLEPLDFGGPRPSDIEYRFERDTVIRFQLELALLCGGELFEDAEGFVRVLRSQFESLRQGLRWLKARVVPSGKGGGQART